MPAPEVMQSSEIVEQIKKMVESTAGACRVQAIFGEPTKLVTQTIVPVGALYASYGGGAGGVALVGGGGVGVTVQVVPLGFIHEEGGVVRFTAITPPVFAGPPLNVTEAPRSGLLEAARARLSGAFARATGRLDERGPGP